MSTKFLTKRTGNSHEHGDRSTHQRRSITKTKNNNNNVKGKHWGPSILAHFGAENIDLGNNFEPKSSNKFNKKGNNLVSEIKKKKKFTLGVSEWYSIKVINGHKYDIEVLEETLLKALFPLPFWPIGWKSCAASATFYIDDYNITRRFHTLDGDIKLPDGSKLILQVNRGIPKLKMCEHIKNKLKLVMMNRYNVANKALDLTNFHYDTNLKEILCPLSLPSVLITVIEIISENFPELEALNLNNNNLQYFSFVKNLIGKLENVKILHLAQNKIRDVVVLDSLISLPLVELLLTGNPICYRLRGKDFVSEVTKRFPKLIKLNNSDVPPHVPVEIEEHISLPSSHETFLCDAQGGPLVREFLEQYFNLFDSNNRQLLVQAYHENAVYSMTVGCPYDSRHKTSNGLNWYLTGDRNLHCLRDSDSRFKLLKMGPDSIVSFLKEMPITIHDMTSFKVDLTLSTPSMMSFTVSGLFKEIYTVHKYPPIRWFSRTFILTPRGNGYCICNEVLHVTNAKDDQIKTCKFASIDLPDISKLLMTIADESVPSASVPSASVPNAPLIPSSYQFSQPPILGIADLDDLSQQLSALSVRSGMNLEGPSNSSQGN